MPVVRPHLNRVLIVEDSPGDARLISDALERMPGKSVEVRTSLSLQEALQVLGTSHWDVVIADLNLPDSVGFQTVRRLLDPFPDLPIVVCTGTDDEDEFLRCVEEGAQDVVIKAQMTPSMLRRVVGFALSRGWESRIRQMELAVARYEAMSSDGSLTQVTRILANEPPIRLAYPELHRQLTTQYRDLFDSYLDQIRTETRKPFDSMRLITRRLGEHGGGPRDLIDLHKSALEALVAGSTQQRARSYAIEGRLLALELMGLLVEFYRLGSASGNHKEQEDQES